MSEENVEIVRRIYEAQDRRDAATVLALYDPEIEADYSRVAYGDPAQEVCRGIDDLRALYRDWYEVWEDYRDELEELIDAGEQVVSVATGRGRGRASGAEVELKHQLGVWTLRDGKVVRVVWFPTRADALEAAGLSE
jgi:ketosteroid isomerase-like protein